MTHRYRMMSAILAAGLAGAALFLTAAEIHDAAKAGDLARVRAIVTENPGAARLPDETGRTPLHWACRGVHVDVVRFLVETGVDVNARDGALVTPLHSVSSRGHLEAARILLDAGARPHAAMSDGSTPLHLAAANGHQELAALLAERGGRLDVQDAREDTPLLAAAWADRWNVVDLLVDQAPGISRETLERRDFDGNTLLHLAGRAGRTSTVRRLVARGIGLDTRNALGQTAFNLAERGGFPETSEFLAKAGADRSPGSFPKLSGPYLGQAPPGTVPQLFAKGIVSTRGGLYGTIAFTPDGREAFWKPETQPMQTMRTDDAGAWGAPETVPFQDVRDFNVPFVSPDGRRLYVMKVVSRTADGQHADKEEIWFSERTGKSWAEPVPFDPVVNSAGMHWQFALDARGDVYLNADGGIRRARLSEGRYAAPELVPPPIFRVVPEEQRYRVGNIGPFVSPGGDYLIFTQFGGVGLVVSFRGPDGSWLEPRDLSERLATGGSDSMAKVTPDGKYLFFQCARSDSGAGRGLYWVDARVIEELRPKR
jgi:ankyrin repeat protein